MPWLRLWTDFLDNPDLHDLPRETRWAWCTFLGAAKRMDRKGELPPLKTLAHWVREPQNDVSRWLDELVTAGLVDSNGITFSMHGWNRWQSPTDRTNAERQKRFRDKQTQSPPAPPNTREEQTRPEVTPLVTALRNGVLDSLVPEDPEIARTAKVAEELAGDCAWALWVSRQSKMGESIQDIQKAIEVCVNENKFDMRLAAGVLKRLNKERAEKNGKAR